MTFTSACLRWSATEAPVTDCTGVPPRFEMPSGDAPDTMSSRPLTCTSHTCATVPCAHTMGSVTYMRPRSL